jgi:hypothetical protein
MIVCSWTIADSRNRLYHQINCSERKEEEDSGGLLQSLRRTADIVTSWSLFKFRPPGIQRGSKAAAFRVACTPRAKRLHNTRASWRTSYANFARDICARFTTNAHHIRESDANVACTCRTRNAQQGMCLLDPSVISRITFMSLWIPRKRISIFFELRTYVFANPFCEMHSPTEHPLTFWSQSHNQNSTLLKQKPAPHSTRWRFDLNHTTRTQPT